LVITTETVRKCPLCDNEVFIRDYEREETYCNKCGLVLSSAVQYIGLEKIDNIIPYSAPVDGSAKRWIHKGDKGKFNNKGITRYKHNIPNHKLMRKGHR